MPGVPHKVPSRYSGTFATVLPGAAAVPPVFLSALVSPFASFIVLKKTAMSL